MYYRIQLTSDLCKWSLVVSVYVVNWSCTCILKVWNHKLSKWFCCSSLKLWVLQLYLHSVWMEILMSIGSNVVVSIVVVIKVSIMVSSLVVVCSNVVVLCVETLVVAILVVNRCIVVVTIIVYQTPKSRSMVIPVVVAMFLWLLMLFRCSRMAVKVEFSVIFVAKMVTWRRIVLNFNVKMASKTWVLVVLVLLVVSRNVGSLTWRRMLSKCSLLCTIMQLILAIWVLFRYRLVQLCSLQMAQYCRVLSSRSLQKTEFGQFLTTQWCYSECVRHLVDWNPWLN